MTLNWSVIFSKSTGERISQRPQRAPCTVTPAPGSDSTGAGLGSSRQLRARASRPRPASPVSAPPSSPPPATRSLLACQPPPSPDCLVPCRSVCHADAPVISDRASLCRGGFATVTPATQAECALQKLLGFLMPRLLVVPWISGAPHLPPGSSQIQPGIRLCTTAHCRLKCCRKRQDLSFTHRCPRGCFDHQWNGLPVLQ